MAFLRSAKLSNSENTLNVIGPHCHYSSKLFTGRNGWLNLGWWWGGVWIQGRHKFNFFFKSGQMERGVGYKSTFLPIQSLIRAMVVSRFFLISWEMGREILF